jgi:NAD(P)-dependent dehydrogenase (short-subunit alcohol dehydrogenase family)
MKDYLMSDMRGKICLITGSNSGIGKETAVGLARMGATVVMVVRNQERMFTYELSRRLQGTGVMANVLMPGFVATNLGKNSGSLSSAIMFTMDRPMQISAKKGVETPLYLAFADEVKNMSGKCFAKKKEVETYPVSYDQEAQKHLWKETIKLLGLKES